MKKLYPLIALILFASSPLIAASVTVSDAWSRPAKKTMNGAVFFKMTGADDKLVSATCDLCDHVELHTHLTEKVTDKDGHSVDVKRMRPVESIAVEKEKVTELKKGGLHIMLMGMKKDLNEGDTVTLNLTFETSGTQTISAKVKKMSGCCGCNKNKEKNKEKMKAENDKKTV